MKGRYIYNLIIFLSALLLISTGAVYAFFEISSESSQPVTFTSSYGGYYDIGSEYGLRVISDEKYYNNSGGVSKAEDRKSVRLTKHITLSGDLTITADLNLNLGGAGCGIDLNGFTLKIRHSLYGSLLISNGDITNSAVKGANFYIDTPNAAVITDTLNIAGNVNYSVLSFSKDALIESIYAKADSCFKGFYNKEVLVEGSGVTHYYLYSDIGLFTNFYNYNISLNWVSGNESVIAGSGKVTPQAADTAVDLTLTLSGGELLLGGGGEITLPLSKTYRAVVISGGFDRLQAGLQELDGYLDYYRYGSDNYYIYGDVNLPRANNYYDLSYTYTASNNIGEYITDLEGYTLKRGFVQRTVTLTAKIENLINSASAQKIYTINVVVKNNYETANRLVENLGLLIIESADTVLPLLSPAELTAQGINGADYSFINNSGNYEAVNNTLRVISLPNMSEVIYLKISFNFIAGEPSVVERQVRIYYVDASMGGGGEDTDPYAYYYAYLTDLLLEKTGGKTFSSFTMPNEHLNHTIEYNITSPSAGLVRASDGSSITLGYNSEGIFRKVLEIIPQGSGTLFDVCFENLLPDDFSVTVSYLFDYGGGEKVYYKKTNTFLINGIIQKNQSGIPDPSLYNAALLNYDGNGDNVITADEAKVVKSDFVVNAAVSDFKGLNYLKGTLRFNLDGTGFNGAAMEYLGALDGITCLSLKNNGLTDSDLSAFAGMRNLETLDLSSNNITGISNLPIYTAVTTLKLSGNMLSGISGINKFLKLHDLYIDNNSIAGFRELLDMPALYGGSVYLYGNSAADGYGSMGRYNLTSFVLMYNKGINLYRELDGGQQPLLFTPAAAEIEGTEALESIIYCNYTQNLIILPYMLYKDINSYYTINWDYSSLVSPAVTYGSPAAGEMSISHSTPEGNIVIYASTDIGGTVIYRPFYIGVYP